MTSNVAKVTAPSFTLTYGQAIPPTPPSITGLVNGDTPSTAGLGSVTCSTTATSNSPAGTYPVTCTGPSSTMNYSVDYVPGTITINKAHVTVVATSRTITYGQPIPAPAARVLGLMNGETSTSAGITPIDCTTTATVSSGVGSYPVTCTGPTSVTNYDVVYAAGTLTIRAAAVTVLAPSPTMDYGQAVPTLMPTITGLIGPDTPSSIGLSVNCGTSATSTSPPGTYPVTCSGPSAVGNYTISYQAGTLTVEQATTATTLAVGPNPAAVNQAVTITATVHHDGAGTAPTGNVTFLSGTTVLATVNLPNTGHVSITTTFGGGAHHLDAVYSGDGNYTGSTAIAVSLSVTCNQTITGTHSSIALSSGTTCLMHATINAGITIPSGAVLDIENSAVAGGMTASGAGGVRICGSHTEGLTVYNSAGFVLIGDPAEQCAPNGLNGGVSIVNNTHGLVFVDNTISGGWVTSGNSGAGPLPGQTAPVIYGNHH
jgi:hypothetical protein